MQPAVKSHHGLLPHANACASHKFRDNDIDFDNVNNRRDFIDGPSPPKKARIGSYAHKPHYLPPAPGESVSQRPPHITLVNAGVTPAGYRPSLPKRQPDVSALSQMKRHLPPNSIVPFSSRNTESSPRPPQTKPPRPPSTSKPILPPPREPLLRQQSKPTLSIRREPILPSPRTIRPSTEAVGQCNTASTVSSLPTAVVLEDGSSDAESTSTVERRTRANKRTISPPTSYTSEDLHAQVRSAKYAVQSKPKPKPKPQWKQHRQPKFVAQAATEPSALELRPYLRKADRDHAKSLRWRTTAGDPDRILHIDFDDREIARLCKLLLGNSYHVEDGKVRLWEKSRSDGIARIQRTLTRNLKSNTHTALALRRNRSDAAMAAFLSDLATGHFSHALTSLQTSAISPSNSNAPHQSHLTTSRNDESVPRASGQITRALLKRAFHGDAPRGDGHRTLRDQFTALFEDSLTRRREWADCSGDIATVTWTPDGSFVCGAIAHSDSDNQQYNKPGNLLFGSPGSSKLFSRPDHRISRPIIEATDKDSKSKQDNASSAMREALDPWVYSSVADSSFQPGPEPRIFTGSYDQTVKAWSLDVSGSEYRHLSTWLHPGRVNFVRTSPSQNYVVTACDAGHDAIRVYDLTGLEDMNLSEASYVTFSGDRASELTQAKRPHQDWDYHVATLAWGLCPSVQNHILVGFSPRAYDCWEATIPEDRRKTGELCLWDVRDGSKLNITSATTSNVFEVVWHPTQPVFLAATSPTGEYEAGTRTQLRLFAPSTADTFTVTKVFDCAASDINEITLMPNGREDCYVTASCTDGKTYVWDSAFNEYLLHVLEHGQTIEAQIEGVDHEVSDVGVKFCAWGATKNRLYTGSSDGCLKAWDVTSPQPFVRDVLKLSGGVAAGAFSHDRTQLVVGDASGKVHLLSIDNGTDWPPLPPPFPRRPPPSITPFQTEVDDSGDSESVIKMAQRFLNNNQLVIHPLIGIIQGSNYASTGLYLHEAHKAGDPMRKYTKDIRKNQRMWNHPLLDSVLEELELSTLRIPKNSSDLWKHQANLRIDQSLKDFQDAQEMLQTRQPQDHKQFSAFSFFQMRKAEKTKKAEKLEMYSEDCIESGILDLEFETSSTC